MDKKNAICVTGFFTSGSSAVTDYLSEFNNTAFIKGREDYEHSLFYIGNGLFELYDRLFSERSNYLSRSHALNEFIDLLKVQYENDFGWFGSYKKLVGESFKTECERYIDSISAKQGVAVDLADYKGVRFSLIKGILQIGAHFVYQYKITKFGRQYKKVNRPFRYLIANEDEFIESSKEFLRKYADFCNKEKKECIVFDHLVTAEQIYGVRDFLPDGYKVIIVDRNPVDIYLLSKYVWDTPKHPYHPPVPLEVNDFCKNYIFQRREIEKIKTMSNVYYVRFEDLVINYDKICEEISSFCNLKAENHVDIKKYFDPSVSIKNIGLAAMYESEADNIAVIKSMIPDSMYTYIENSELDRKSVF